MMSYSLSMKRLKKNGKEYMWKQISPNLLLNMDHVTSIHVDGKNLVFVLVCQMEHVVTCESEEKALKELSIYHRIFFNTEMVEVRI